MNNECEWVQIPGYEGRYEISTCGRVRTMARIAPRTVSGFSSPVRVKRKELRPSSEPGGYPAIELTNEAGRRRLYMHRLLAQAFIPNPLNLPVVNHIDGDKTNNALQNLEWCTHAQNAAHASKAGLLPKGLIGPGEKCPAAKLTDEKVREIRRRVAAGETQRAVAKEFGVTYGNVSLIVNRGTWSHV